jgi:hypothetical protein
MDEKKSRSIAAGLGLGAAALLAAGQADAATEAFQVAAGDNRLGVIATLFIPALGWVAFNMLQPLQVKFWGGKHFRGVEHSAAGGRHAGQFKGVEHSAGGGRHAGQKEEDSKLHYCNTFGSRASLQ